MIKSFRNKALTRFFLKGDGRGIKANLTDRLSRRLDVLDSAASLTQLNLPGFDFHGLRSKPKRYSIHVNGNWCLTFEWDKGNATRVDLEDYH